MAIYIGKPLLDGLYEDALRRTTEGLSVQFLFFVREVKSICTTIVNDVAAGGIRGVRLIQLQNSLRQVKSNVNNWQYGSLTSAAVRNMLVARDGVNYPSSAETLTAMQAINVQFNGLTAEIEGVIAAARAGGQIYDSNSTTGEEVYLVLSSPETDAIVSFCTALIADITE